MLYLEPAGADPQMSALVRLVTVEPAAWFPFSFDKFSFIDGEQTDN